VPDLTDTQTVNSASSILLITATASIAEATDRGAFFRLYIDSTGVGPVAQAWTDATGGECGGMTIQYAVTGYSGSTTFECKWIEMGTAGAQLDTTDATPYSLQVVEIQDNASIIVNLSTSAAGSPPATASDANPLMQVDSVSVDGTGSILLFLATCPSEWPNPDGGNMYRFAVDGTMEGPATHGWSDNSNEEFSASNIYANNGYSAGTHNFDLLWEYIASPGTDNNSTYLSTFQVVEITAEATLHSSITSTTSWTHTTSDANDPALDVDDTITDASAVVYWGAAFSQRLSGSSVDHSVIFHLGLDDTSVSGVFRAYQDYSTAIHGAGMSWADSMSAASHSFQLRGYEDPSDGAMHVDHDRHLFVIELDPVAATRRVFNIS
jgi:hypothetical protein